MKRLLTCWCHKYLGYDLYDVRSIFAGRALRRMPKGTFVIWNHDHYTCYIRKADGKDIEPYGIGPFNHKTRSGAILLALDEWEKHCSYHGIKEDEWSGVPK